MKKEIIEKIMSRDEELVEQVNLEESISYSLIFMIRNTIENGNSLLNIDEVLWENEYLKFEEALDNLEVEELTVSDHSTALIRTLSFLDSIGFEMMGMTKVYTGSKDWKTGEKEVVPAVKLKRKKV